MKSFINLLKNIFRGNRMHMLNSDFGKHDPEPILIYCPDGLEKHVLVNESDPFCPQCGDRVYRSQKG